MIKSRIPLWFREENKDNNIWKPPLDYKVIEKEIGELELGIESGWKERSVQKYLKDKHYLFDGLCRHGHGTFVFHEESLAGKYFPDWVIGSGHSGGIMWELIELECPQSIPFNQDGHFSKETRKGIKQIDDWRIWITQNIDMAQRSKSLDGLGLYDLSHHAKGTVVVGRRSVYDNSLGHAKYNKVRKECETRQRIDVISYDTLLERMRFHIKRLTTA